MRIHLPLSQPSERALHELQVERVERADIYVNDSCAGLGPQYGSPASRVALTTCEARVYEFYVDERRVLPRHDVPCLGVRMGNHDRVGDRVVRSVSVQQSIQSTAVLWYEEQFAGREGVFVRSDSVNFAAGVLLEFPGAFLMLGLSRVATCIEVLDSPELVQAALRTYKSVVFHA